ncbi:putative metallopeptidase [Anaeroselena agilis]|uniref:Metallopeptidase n=1 Tax=Anaeroselena agilis TaxID=3063788 RepID=A0ABU3NZH4_9FIRM|nr:putative metallopeptidase [Selenomonadales bacterium 4137-cl]
MFLEGDRVFVPVRGVILRRRTRKEMDGNPELGDPPHKRFDIILDLPDGNRIVKEYDTDEVECYDCRVDPDLRALADKVIDVRMEVAAVIDGFIGRERICYVTSWEPKKKKGSAKMVLAECRAVRDSFRALTDFRFIITFYEPNIMGMCLDERQRAWLMLHELKHIKFDGGIEEHSVEDFASILAEAGLEWNSPGAEVPDLLEGGNDA